MAGPEGQAGANPRPADNGVHFDDAVIAKVVAHHTLAVPGVIGLRPKLASTVANLAGRVVRPGNSELQGPSADGVTVTVEDETGTASVTIDVVLRLGVPLLEVAKHIQQDIGTVVRESTGLTAVVTVNIVDVGDAGSEP